MVSEGKAPEGWPTHEGRKRGKEARVHFDQPVCAKHRRRPEITMHARDGNEGRDKGECTVVDAVTTNKERVRERRGGQGWVSLACKRRPQRTHGESQNTVVDKWWTRWVIKKERG